MMKIYKNFNVKNDEKLLPLVVSIDNFILTYFPFKTTYFLLLTKSKNKPF